MKKPNHKAKINISNEKSKNKKFNDLGRKLAFKGYKS